MQPQIRNTSRARITPGSNLRECFAAYVEGAYDKAEFTLLLSGRCAEEPESIWEVLALLDQFDRKGQLRAADFASFKTALEQSACRVSPSLPGQVRNEGSETAQYPTDENTREVPMERQPAAPLTWMAERPRPVRLTSTAPVQKPADPVGVRRIPPAIPLELAAGSILRNRFVLEAVLGRGGMGTVFRALDRNRSVMPEGDRHVAVKVLRPEFEARPEALEALAREFNQAQRLSHPGIVKVFDFDCDQGRHFITMELLPGRTLEEMLALRRDFPPLERSIAWTILGDLGDAIAHAHESGVVHADLKPANAMFAETGQLRVLDFGMAHALPTGPSILDSPAPFLAATRTYASCQRLEGHMPDARDDIFSYACICYEVLTGHHPFGRRSALEARQAEARPERPARITRRQWRALLQALAWERQDRPESIRHLIRELGVERSGPVSMKMPAQSPRLVPGKTVSLVVAACLAIAMTWSVGTGNGARPFAIDTAVSTTSAFSQSAREWVRQVAGTARRLQPDGAVQPRDATLMPSEVAMPDAAVTTEAPPPPLPEPPVAEPASDAVADTVTVAAPLPLAGKAEVPVAGRPGILAFASDTVTVSEATNVVRLIVRRTGGTRGVVSFNWRTSAGNALAGSDFASFGTVSETMEAGQSSASILVPIVMDGIKEKSEAFSIEILDPAGGAVLGNVTRALVIIIDDD